VNYRPLFILFLLISSLVSSAQVPVMLHLSRALQADTLVANFPAELTSLVQPLILKGKVTLWDSPQKKLQISPSGLQNLEQNAGTEFSAATDLFIYELWNENKKNNIIDIVGISFTHRNQNGKESVFGFIDYYDLLPHLKQKINVNANGSFATTFEDIFKNKFYDFNVVQYDNKTIQSIQESIQIIDNGMKNKKINTGNAIPQNKMVYYQVQKNTSGQEAVEKNTQALIFAFEKYFSENPEVFLNFGGEFLVKDFSAHDIYISKIEVEELWSKKSDGTINYQPLNLRIFINEVPLEEISYSHWQTWGIIVNGIPADEFIKEKKIIFTINKINNQVISKNEAGLYQKALYNYDWNKLSAYVKSF
jgi:hypothetical protein